MTRFVRVALPMALAAGWMAAAAPEDRFSVSHERAGGAGTPEVIVIRDNTAGIEAAVAPTEGGELSSLRVKVNGKWVELLYRARDYAATTGFRGKASFLWPAVGGQYAPGTIPASSCADGSYPVGDRRYPMPCHGFAKDLPWKETGSSADARGARVVVELRDSGKTHASYPFGFVVRSSYEISGGKLFIAYTISSGSDNTAPMPFSIGNHLAFRIPFQEGTDPADMVFNSPNSTELLRDSHGLVTDRQRARSFNKPALLSEFDATVALPLAGYKGGVYARLADPQGLSIRITQLAASTLPEPLVRFNVYGGPKQGYFCPEPWFGLQNSLNLDHGAVTLKPGEDWQWTIEISPQIFAPATPSGINKQ